MSKDKRSVSTDALETLGTIIGVHEKRDAIHLAVEPVTAGEMLYPRADIGIHGGKAYSLKNPRRVKALGIVDPFLTKPVKKDERFWLIIYPRQITSLRHVWSHPDFEQDEASSSYPQISSKEASERWLRDFCENHDCPDYESVMAVINADNGVQFGNPEYYGLSRIEGEYFMFYGIDAHGEIPNKFWDHVEVVTGNKVSYRARWFSCSC